MLSGGLALAVGFGFFLLKPRWPEAKLFAVFGIAAYVPWMLSPLLMTTTLLASGVAAIVGGAIAVRVAGVRGMDSSWRVGVVSTMAIGLAAIGFFAGFVVSYDFNRCWFDTCASDTFNAKLFAIIAGCVPSLCAAVGSLTTAVLSRLAT